MTVPRDDRVIEAHRVLDRMEIDARNLFATLRELRCVLQDEAAEDDDDA